MLTKRFIGISFILVVSTLLYTPSVSAHHRSKVLGVSTENTTPVLPPTVEGPGMLLPDSPLFFLDDLKQNVKLALALGPEAKAKAHAEIAGERLAELRYMLAKNNAKGINTALEGVSENLKKAAEDINQGQLSGKNVAAVAKEINTFIKQKQQALDLLEAQTDGEMQKRVEVVNQAVTDAKITVEDSLPDEDLEKEIQDDISRIVSKKVEEAADSSKDIEQALKELEEGTNDSAQKALKNRREALEKALQDKNEVLKKEKERLLEQEKQKQFRIVELQKQQADQSREIVRKAQEAAVKFKNTRAEIDQLRNQSTDSFLETTTPKKEEGREVKKEEVKKDTTNTNKE